MHWIIQDNLHREEGFVALIETLERFSIPHSVVKVLPFSDHLPTEEQTIPVINPEGRVMVCGSTTLAKMAARRGWVPGSFLNENHDYEVWRQHYGDALLNHDARVCRFADVEPLGDARFFIRPCLDSKSFAGQVMDWPEFEAWRHRVLDLGEVYTSLDGNTMVAYGPVKVIRKEFRFFVVDGRVVTGSLYKIGTRVVYNEVVDDEATLYAQQMVDRWQPARAFVIDIADTDEGYRIVEINCLNSAGFYAIDVQKLVMAIEAMEF